MTHSITIQFKFAVIIVINTTLVCCTGDFPCIGTCYSGQVTPEPQDIIHGKHLKGYSYKNITTDSPNKCYSSCVQDCRCKACQMQDTRCELLEEDKSSKSSDFVATVERYVYYDMKQTLYHGAYHMLPPGKCYNGCCKSQPCMNGGTCTEHCHDPKLKFTCACSKYFAGTVCEKFTSCMSVWKSKKDGGSPADGVYDIFNNITATVLPLYCSFEQTVPARAWSLIESQSLANKDDFLRTTFYDNTSFNILSPPSWDRYRLNGVAIKYLRSKATLFRATCDFPQRGGSPLLSDYLLGSLIDTDITSTEPFGGKCRKFKLINIKGYKCSDCTTSIYGNQLKILQHLHIDTTWVTTCTFKADLFRNGNYFGFHIKDQIDTSFTCTKTNKSTTQWWLGEEES